MRSVVGRYVGSDLHIIRGIKVGDDPCVTGHGEFAGVEQNVARVGLLDVCSTDVANGMKRMALQCSFFLLQRQFFSFALSCYFGSDLWRLPTNRCGPCEFSMFSMTYGRDCESDALRNRDASYTSFSESATRTTRIRCLGPRRQLHVGRRRLRSRRGTLWCARCWVSDARLLLVSSTASS